MRRALVATLGALVLVLAFSSSAAADVKVKDSGSPDSGTCGNNWANDTFNREFDVSQDRGAFVLTEFFKDGHFVTIDGKSPGGCETGGSDHGQWITGGVTGSFHGFISGTVTGGTFNPDAKCPDPCNGDTFTAAFFGKDATWNVTTDWSFQYEAQGGGLLFRRWTNAGSGNVGDIATS
jgi:hypothetical protein